MIELPSADRLRELFSYDQSTGRFTHKSGRYAGRLAGSLSSHGYRQIGVDGEQYYAHRLAWVFMTGSPPIEMIDHKNGDRGDNSFSNLRDVPNIINTQSRHKKNSNNSSGLPGAYFDKMLGRWKSTIMVNGKTRHLGVFDTPESANRAFVAAKQKYTSVPL